MAALLKLNKFVKFPKPNRCCLLVAKHQSTIRGEEKVKNGAASDEFNSFSLDSLLQNDNGNGLAATMKKLNLLSKLVSSETISAKELHDHPKFEKFCSSLDKKIPSLTEPYLLNTLRSVYSLKLPGNTHIVQSIQTQIMWNSRKMSLSNLIYLINLLIDNDQSNDNKIHSKILTETKEMIQRRWVELDLSDVCSLFPLMQREEFSKEFVNKVDDRLLDVIEEGSIENLTRLFSSLSVVKRRSTPILRALSFHLCKKHEKLSVKQIATLLNAMSALNFPDQNLLDRLLTDLMPEIKSINKPSTMAAILTAIGQLKWKNYALLDSCAEWMSNHVEECRVKDMVSFILTCGNLNYVNENIDVIAKLKMKIAQKDIPSPFIWLDYVLSLVILKKADHEHVTSVLIPQFTELITKSASHKIKLLYVDAAAKYEMKKFKGPFLDPSLIDVTLPVSKVSNKFKTLIFDGLSNFIPEGKYLTTNKIINGAIQIDAEFIMDKNRRPLALNEYRSKTGNNPDNLKPLPYGANRIALMIWNFKDLTLNNEITGGNALLIRILQKLAYVVCEIQHHEFPLQEKILKKVQFLQKKIDEAIQNKYKSK